MSPHIGSWVEQFFFVGDARGVREYNTILIANMQMDLHLEINWTTMSKHAMESVLALRTSPDIFLNVVDWCLANDTTGVFGGRLQQILDRSASAYTVTREASGRSALSDRIDPTVTTMVRNAAPPSSRAAAHLQLAWSHIYGLKKDASSGYRESIRAVEAAAKPIISPTNASTTLGTIIADIESKPSKWRFPLTPESGVSGMESTAALMRLIWKSQLDRHGTDDEGKPITVSLEEAEAALHISALLVHLLTSGRIVKV